MRAVELREALALIGAMLNANEASHPRGSDNHWRTWPASIHAQRALAHGEKFLAGLEDEDHLCAMACRTLLALQSRENTRRWEREIEQKESTNKET